MSAAEKYNIVSIQDYLEGEELSPVKHEYLGGVVYAMAGGKVNHNTAAGNVLISLGNQLKGRSCRPFNSDMKVRIQTPSSTRFYYPDVSVLCQSNPPESPFQDHPVVIVEVASASTRRLDEGEKKDAYLQIPSLRAYLLIDTDRHRVRVFRRLDNGFAPELYDTLAQSIPLPEIGCALPLADIYDNVTIGLQEEIEEKS